MTGPARREFRRTHLDASVVPVERAFLARADALAAEAARLRDQGRANGPLAGICYGLGDEFRQLAEELHWWLR